MLVGWHLQGMGHNHTIKHKLRVCLRIEITIHVAVDVKVITQAAQTWDAPFPQLLQLVPTFALFPCSWERKSLQNDPIETRILHT